MERDSLLYKLRRKGQALAGKILPAEWMAKLYSRIVLKKKVDLQQPQTFNEKIQWCKLYYYPNDPLVVKCTDKYTVREYVREKGLSHILVPLYGSWHDARDIQWEDLPNQFVLKCNHGCAYNIVCDDFSSFDRQEAAKKLTTWMKEDFGLFNIEPHYSLIRPRRIICEEYLGSLLLDYKFFCFNGEVKFLYVARDLLHDRSAQSGFYNLDGSKMLVGRNDRVSIGDLTIPPFFTEIIQAASVLCKDFPFVRVDFFVTDDRFYFAELTFTPSGGMMPFNPEDIDSKWGRYFDISELMKKNGGPMHI